MYYILFSYNFDRTKTYYRNTAENMAKLESLYQQNKIVEWSGVNVLPAPKKEPEYKINGMLATAGRI